MSRARALALAASFPVSCSTIFCLNPSENGLVTVPSLPRPRRKKGGSDNYAAAGGRRPVDHFHSGGVDHFQSGGIKGRRKKPTTPQALDGGASSLTLR